MSKPVHIDYTTLFGAARAIEDQELKRGLPLSRLLSLSQLLEAVVLNEEITYELGSSPDWVPYADALQKSTLMHRSAELGLPLRPMDYQVDRSEAVTQEAIVWAVTAVPTINLRTLFWAIHFRSGTYSGIGKTADGTNPMVQKYMTMAAEMSDPAFRKLFRAALQLLHQNDIGPLGLAILIRIGLFNRVLVETGLAHYHPHYSRQPVVVTVENPTSSLQAWTMQQIGALRKKILKDTDSLSHEDVLSTALSPIFLACLAQARSPIDLLERAREIRDSRAARDYRKEVTSIWRRAEQHPELPLQYRIRLSERVKDLNDLLFEKGKRSAYFRQWDVGLKRGIPLGWQFGWRIQKEQRKQPGDKAVVLLSDILRQSLAVVQAQRSIATVFGVPANYDTDMISCATPRAEGQR